MTLSEIETILEELSLRHPDLSKEMLTTMLLSAGWEDKLIKDAVALFLQKNPNRSTATTPQPEVVKQVSAAEISYLKQDGEKERVVSVAITEAAPPIRKREEKGGNWLLQLFGISFKEVTTYSPPPVVQKVTPPPEPLPPPPLPPEPVYKEEEKPRVIVIETKVEEPLPVPPPLDIVTPPVPIVPQEQAPLPELPIIPSLIVEEVPEKIVITQKESDIPHNLPLVPFESSPHVWSFSDYKDVYHKDENEKAEVVNTKNSTPHVPSGVVTSEPSYSKIDEEIVLEKTSMTKGDEGLVVLASVMLFVIIIILGYMYSNGRL